MRHILTSTLVIGALSLAGCNERANTADSQQTDLVTSAEQGDVRVAIHAASLNAEAGEPIELIVTVEAPPNLRASLELPEGEQLGSFDLLRVEEARETGDALAVADKRRLLISTFESGDVELPPLVAQYGNDSTLSTDPVSFSITSLIEGEFNPADFDDIRGPVAPGLDENLSGEIITAIAVGAGIIVAALAIALALGIRRRVRPRIPHEWALAELARIGAEGPPKPDATARRFEQIETVLRWYVAFRFEIDAPDQTSNELLEAVVAHHEIDDTARAVLERIVRDGDRIKFAAGVASTDDCNTALGSARLFVETTIPATNGKEEAA